MSLYCRMMWTPEDKPTEMTIIEARGEVTEKTREQAIDVEQELPGLGPT